jgi:hypothetical protein
MRKSDPDIRLTCIDELSSSFVAQRVEFAALQLTACFAVEGVRFVNNVTRTSFRDAHTLLQHSSESSLRCGSAGRLMLDLESDWVW